MLMQVADFDIADDKPSCCKHTCAYRFMPAGHSDMIHSVFLVPYDTCTLDSWEGRSVMIVG